MFFVIHMFLSALVFRISFGRRAYAAGVFWKLLARRGWRARVVRRTNTHDQYPQPILAWNCSLAGRRL